MKGSLKVSNDMIFYESSSIEVLKTMDRELPNISKMIKPQFTAIILSALQGSPTTQSLLTGKLKDDFGLFGNVVTVTIANIVDYISKNIIVDISRSKISGSILTLAVTIPAGDVKNIIRLDGASYPSKGGDVNWLEWLLTKGTEIVIGDFWLYPYAKGFTRSGGTSVMLKLVNQGEPFRVDPGHAGTETDNFIIRAIEPYAQKMLEIAADAVSRRYK